MLPGCSYLFLLVLALATGSDLIAKDDQEVLRHKRQVIDFSQAYADPDTGLQCIDKEASIQTKQREQLLECVHSDVNVCHYTYITRFTSQRQDECKDNYEKKCSISFKQTAANETIEK